MDERSPDLDAVALGLKRSPRGAAALVFLAVIAVVGGVLSTGVSQEPAAPVTEVAEAVAPPTPAPSKRRAVVSKRSRSSPRTMQAPVTAPPPPAPVEVEETETKVATPLEPPPPPPAPAPEPEPEEAVAAPEPAAPLALAEEPIEVDGNGAAIARLIADSKRAAVRACFESELKQAPKLRGTVTVELDLAPPNKVTEVRVSDDLERPAFTRCVRATMQSIRFTGLDEDVSVSVPYTLTPQSK